jgi:Spy/CpxP family protein refolding chaperone
MKNIRAVVAGVAAGVALAVGAVTYAQPLGSIGPGMGMGMGPGHGPMAGVDSTTMIDSRLSDLKALLKITGSQESAWQAFVTAAKQQATDMQAIHTQMLARTGTAPERMGQRATAMQQRAQAMTTITNAFNALYAVLTPEQKTIADQHSGMMGTHAMRFGARAG